MRSPLMTLKAARRGVLQALFVGSLLSPAVGLAQDAPAGEAAAPATTAAAKKDFAKEARLRDLRHKHLWMAYGAVWLIIFGFIWRTHALSRKTDGELQRLKVKLEALEAKHDG